MIKFIHSYAHFKCMEKFLYYRQQRLYVETLEMKDPGHDVAVSNCKFNIGNSKDLSNLLLLLLLLLLEQFSNDCRK